MPSPARLSTAFRNVGRGLALAGGLVAAPGGGRAYDPSPLRREDALRGRDFDLTGRTFLNRFTFRPRPEMDQAWRQDPSGFRATAGSLRSKELLVEMELRMVQPLDERFDFEFRYHRDEDFDGRFDRAVAGMGWHGGETWRLALLGEILPEKEDIDVYAEWTWTPRESARLRLAGVAVDATFDRKSDEGRYDQDPWTWFADLHFRPDPDTQIDAWVNWNPEARLDLDADDLRFRHRQVGGGGAVDRRIAGPWFVTLDGEVGRTRKHWERNRGTSPAEEDLTRHNQAFGLEIRRNPDEGMGGWLGVRRFRIDEAFRGDDAPHSLDRRETTLHGGLLIPLASERALFWPGLYLNRLSTDEPSSSQAEPDGSRRRVGQVKLTLPLEIGFSGGAILTLNATTYPTRLRNGGGNVQLMVPF